jgi:hypothetical protein
MFPPLQGSPEERKQQENTHIPTPTLEPLFEELIEGGWYLGWRRKQNWPYKASEDYCPVQEPGVEEHAVTGPMQHLEKCQDF